MTTSTTPPRGRYPLLLAAVFLVGLVLVTAFEVPLPLREQRSPDAVLPRLPVLEEVRPVAELSDAFIAIAEVVTPAVVRIQTERVGNGGGGGVRELRDLFGMPGQEDLPLLAGGTGFIVTPDGYILTNNHVIDGADRITVTLVDKRSFSARVVGRDPTTDVAVIKIDASELPAAQLGDSEAARVGEWVLAIGNPGFGDASTLDFTVTSGIVSAKGRPLDVINRELQATGSEAASYAIEDFLQTDAVINPGNSGGPLVNLRGEVIGINTAIASGTGFYQGYGFAIPSNLARRVMRDLIEHGHVRRALLGISIVNVSPEDAEVYRLPEIAGVLVEDFADDSPARKAGVQRNDVIVSVAGTRVERVGQFQRLIATHRPGETVAIGVIRYGRPHTFRVRLAQAPIPPTVAVPASRLQTGIGIQLAEITPAMARELGLSESSGVVVTDVAPHSAAARKGIEPGDRILQIDGRAVTLRDAQSRLRALRSGEIVSLLLRSGTDGRTRIANVRTP
jgi:serine protease Do